jgi:exodeoxyribonuclease VII small subunit
VSEEQPSYEQAREELVDVVRRLESGGTDLEESLALWERGERLAQICQAWLDGARKRLDAATSPDAGNGSGTGHKSGDGPGEEPDGLEG